MGVSQKFIASIPKTEIHLHIEACVRAVAYKKLMRKYDIPLNKENKGKIDFSKIESLADMLESFYFVQSFFREPPDFLHVVEEVVLYAERNNIYYIEAFASPSMVVNRGLISFDEMFSTLVDGFSQSQTTSGVDVRLIVDVSRSFGPENAMKNLDSLLSFLSANPTDRIIGIGLGGQELGNPCSEYKDVFAKARSEGLHVVAHAGEVVGPESVWEAIDVCKVERIGHGTSVIEDPRLMETLKERGIPLEICPKSNVITKTYVSEYKDHPIRKYFDMGLTVTVNTDDPILFSIELNEEYAAVAKHLDFSKEEILELVRTNLMSTFLPDDVKERHWLRVQQSLR